MNKWNLLVFYYLFGKISTSCFSGAKEYLISNFEHISISLYVTSHPHEGSVINPNGQVYFSHNMGIFKPMRRFVINLFAIPQKRKISSQEVFIQSPLQILPSSSGGIFSICAPFDFCVSVSQDPSSQGSIEGKLYPYGWYKL